MIIIVYYIALLYYINNHYIACNNNMVFIKLAVKHNKTINNNNTNSNLTVTIIITSTTHELSRFSSIKHFYYDQTVNGRSHNLSWIKSLDDLVAAGSAITDEELRAARDLVQPQDTAMHLFSSVSYSDSVIQAYRMKLDSPTLS